MMAHNTTAFSKDYFSPEKLIVFVLRTKICAEICLLEFNVFHNPFANLVSWLDVTRKVHDFLLFV
jgi:hypothetical protein